MTVQTHVSADVGRDSGIAATLANNAHWLLRAGLASVFLYHGLQKFLVMGVAGFAEMMGMPLAMAFLVSLAEVLAGAGILAGSAVGGRLGDIATRLAGVAVVPVMLGAIAMVHWGQWSFVASDTHPMGGMEFQVVLLLMGVYFALRGNDA
jgi:putative oxidoreductase